MGDKVCAVAHVASGLGLMLHRSNVDAEHFLTFLWFHQSWWAARRRRAMCAVERKRGQVNSSKMQNRIICTDERKHCQSRFYVGLRVSVVSIRSCCCCASKTWFTNWMRCSPLNAHIYPGEIVSAAAMAVHWVRMTNASNKFILKWLRRCRQQSSRSLCHAIQFTIRSPWMCRSMGVGGGRGGGWLAARMENIQPELKCPKREKTSEFIHK